MNNRKSIVLLLLGVILLTGAHLALTYCGGEDVRIVRRETLLDQRARVTSICVERKGAAAVCLQKSDVWRLVAPFSGSVDQQAVMKLVDGLMLAKIEDESSDADILKIGRSRADFHLDEPWLSIILKDGADARKISFGAFTPSSNGVYTVMSDADAVFVVSSNVLSTVDVSADHFRRRSLFLVGAESVSGFGVKRGSDSKLEFVREGETWKIGEQQASAAKIKAFLAEVLSAEAREFVWPTGATNEAQSATASRLAVYELDPESAVTMTMKCVDGRDRQVSFGGESGEGRVFALVQNGAAIVTVDAKLRELAMQDAVMFTDSRIFPFDAKTVSSFAISDGEADYAVARDAEGGWRLDSPVAAPADSDTVVAILDKLLSLSAIDIRSVGLKVVLSTNSAPVIVSERSVLGGRKLADLRSKDILKIDPVLVRRIVSMRPGEQEPDVVVYGRERRAWSVDVGGRTGTVDEKGVLSVLSAINPLRAVRIEKLKTTADELARYGLEKPFLTIAIDQDREDSVRRNIQVGDRTDDGRFATVGSSDAVFVLSDATVENLAAQVVEKSEETK